MLSGDVSAVVEIAVNALNVGAGGGCGSDNSADGRAVSVNGTFVKAADNTLGAGAYKIVAHDSAGRAACVDVSGVAAVADVAARGIACDAAHLFLKSCGYVGNVCAAVDVGVDGFSHNAACRRDIVVVVYAVNCNADV